MVKKLGCRDPYLNSYHHTDSLLFQFILSEFIQTFTALVSLEKLRINDPASLSIKEQIKILAGEGIGAASFVPWGHGQGTLLKLKSFIDILNEEWLTRPETKILTDLQKRIHHTCYAALDALDSARDKSLLQTPHNLDKLLSSSQKLKNSLSKALPCFKDDENVIFYLIRHHSSFTAIYGTDFILKIFKKMFRGGLDEANRFLQKSYTERHFEHLLPVIKVYFNALEKGHQ